MGKKVLGLDLGTTSIGWALVNEVKDGNSEIIKLGVRVNPLTVDEQTDFEKGRPLSTNADRTLKRGARRNLQRFKQRREHLIELLIFNKLIADDALLTEVGKNTTHNTLQLRAQAATQKVSLEDFAKILLTINKKRGYKSSRKAKNDEEGSLIDGMAIAKELYEANLTPGEYVYNLLKEEKKFIPDFYRSDLQSEFHKVWNVQKQFYPNLLTDKLLIELEGKGSNATWAICKDPFSIEGIKLEGKREEIKLKKYELRTIALQEKINLEHLAIVLQEINNNLNNSSGYLGAISDRSKALYFNNETVGENLYRQIQENFHTSLKNQVFYRQDYLDEFEQIWETQAKYHTELTEKLKAEIRDVIIFYQRKLKSQKHLIAECEFEKYHKAIPKSSFLFQEFKIWQNINNLVFTNKLTKEQKTLSEDDRELLFAELNIRGNLKETEVLKFFGYGPKEWKSNYTEGVEGNRTNESLYNIYQHILTEEGYGFDWNKRSALEIKEEVRQVFKQIGIEPKILDFDVNLNKVDKQESYQLWHLLYSAEDDHKIDEADKFKYGNSNVAIKKILERKYGIEPKYGNLFANMSLQQDYGSLSAKAIKKIIPFLQSGNDYAEACRLAEYNHSSSLTKEELKNRQLKEKLELVPKNSLRNPVVEKILNQMINVINEIVNTYGKPDEIRIELARELKKSAKQRAEMTSYINKATKANDDFRKLITKEFGIPNPTKNDVVRYKLYEELKRNGYKTIFSNQYIEKKDLFSKKIDIEHIIPKALLFDDSFSNKTLAFREVNLKKGARTGIDFITDDYNSELESYNRRIENLYDKGKGSISKGKFEKLKTSREKLPEGFIERDLKNSQYIAKKAKEMLFEVFENVITTNGNITSKLREDWDLINVMKELNLAKYQLAGLTEIEERKEGKKVEIIKDWTKRNDHRHHAMDALTVAFTTHNHIQYLNNLNAIANQDKRFENLKNSVTSVIKTKSGKTKRIFTPPITNFRTVAKKHIASILISFKAKNKVVTKNVNKTRIKGKDKYKFTTQLTPRGQLHKETVYGKSKRELQKKIKLSKKFTFQQLNLVVDLNIKNLLQNHLAKFDNNFEKAFDAKTLKKEPILYKGEPIFEVRCFEEIYTIRKDITPDLKIEKVVDEGVRNILQNRLDEYNNNKKEAFSNLDKNPIWLKTPLEKSEWKNKNQPLPHEIGIAIKRVKISGVSNAEALHVKKDHFGNEIVAKDGLKKPVDFVSTGNNHHVAIYKDETGKLHESVVSFYEAVARVNAEQPIIDKTLNSDLGWTFLFTMKQNEMFLFPPEDFNFDKKDLLDEKNRNEISKYLFRVQKISTKNYLFTHHLETMATTGDDLKKLKLLIGEKYHFIQTPSNLGNCIKIRINHIGQIVQIGEY
ncbi:type II CRISPR RNA-guided endonuclease Cas9 [Putridiphycobacter roseus]|uniref:CRISPR-associated endonuclease Cas9 n=1 Tax=Putridiphycobacter roseus TaxID=2219161 RepID=A0A2W1NNC8_9FLAO|nr:type II CRISPR RNA-guided endonuclease Cas9 [Putridiphycobacter roseus]PZE17152.1 type II CRISPR RNA-guided endonuclease Cas9 [Putridiphycobacter roseus]